MAIDILTMRSTLVLGLAVTLLYVGLAWLVARRFGPRWLLAVWLGATACVVLAAALRRGPASADELLLARPATAWVETAVLTAAFALPAFGLAARSVRKRVGRHPGLPTFADWAASVGAAGLGLLATGALLMVFALLLWR